MSHGLDLFPVNTSKAGILNFVGTSSALLALFSTALDENRTSQLLCMSNQ